MPSLALWAMFLTTAAWAESTAPPAPAFGRYGRKQLTSAGVHVRVINVPKL